MMRCANCGKDISEYAIKCPNCGAANDALRTYHLQKSDNSPKKVFLSKKFKMLFLIFGGIFLLVDVFMFICSLNAYRTALGRSPYGVGAILFSKQIINHEIGLIVLVLTLSSIVLLAFIIACVLYFRKKRHKAI